MSGIAFEELLLTTDAEFQTVAESEYRNALRRAWWPLLVQSRKANSARAVLRWLVSTLRLTTLEGEGRDMSGLAAQATVIPVETKSAGIKLSLNEFTDVDGAGFDLGMAWAAQVGAVAGYQPQRMAAKLLRTGHLSKAAGGFNAYDGQPLFSANHPLDPFGDGSAVYSNRISARPIDDSVTLDVAHQNLGAIFRHIGAIQIPGADGEEFRCLQPKALIVPPALLPRARRLCAVLMAHAAVSLGESIEGVSMAYVDALAAAGSVVAVQAGELSGFENETSFFVVCDQTDASELGAMVYVDREPVRLQLHTPETSAALARTQEVQWTVDGRNALAPGHPFLIFRVDAS